MARLMLRRLILPVIVTFLLVQLAIWLLYDVEPNHDDEERASHPGPIDITKLLSVANVSVTVRQYREKVKHLNNQQILLNQELYGEFGDDDNAPVFVIQIHDRVAYIKELLRSLQQVPSINSTVIVFSHDFYSEEINFIIRGIKFARVLQIFYPYSMQLYPHGYPGPDPENIPLPEGYGRTAQLAQIKLHWAWKLKQVFERVRMFANHTGPEIFLEEDHFVLPDILHTLRMSQELQKVKCPTCLIVLGRYPKESQWKSVTWDAIKWTWFYSSSSNMGMVLDRTFWTRFKKCFYKFCHIDEYNWDWTLQHLNHRCFKEKLQILQPDAPRVFHVGDCGTHTSKKAPKQCGRLRQLETVEKVKKLVRNHTSDLFPVEFTTVLNLKQRTPKTPDPFGGWADPRDHKLCLGILKN